MNYRLLGRTGYMVSEVSIGTWQLGGGWGNDYDEKIAEHTLNEAIDHGINFIDTADAYQRGNSEKAIGKVLRNRKERIYVGTKCGRKLNPHVSEGYNEKNIRRFVEESLRNLGVDTLDLLQLHCPPWEVYYRPEVFDVLDALQQEEKVRFYGVSVEKVEQGLKAIEYPGVSTVQIIFNMFRQRPAELFFPEAKKRDVGIIVRVPLASGLLTGRFSVDTVFGERDHRSSNREGILFDRGETFAGVDFEYGVNAAEELKKVFDSNYTLAQYALRWILMFDEVGCVIPGASKASHIESNAASSGIPAFSREQMEAVRTIYERMIRRSVHHLW